MNFSLATVNATKTAAELLILPLLDSEVAAPEKGKPSEAAAALRAVDGALEGMLLEAARSEGFRAKPEQTFVFHTHGKLKATRVLLIGLGAKAKLTDEVLRQCAGRAAKTAHRLRATAVTFALPAGDHPAGAVKAAVEGFVLGDYRFDRYRTTNKEEKAIPPLAEVTLLLPEGQGRGKELDEAIDLGQRIGVATNWARDLVNEPAGVLTPTRLADEAKKAAKAHGFEISVGGLKDIQKLKMGMFLGVAQGSVEEPKLVHAWYTPKNAKHAKRPPICLVGKAITFDSGGLSLKTADGMVDMKTDMAGSAAVLGAMQVIAALQPPFPVHAFLGACENMPSGTAYRPGDVLISRRGKTVEITNTDAEGRLVLGDMLTWACELKPAAVIDIATLTGACIIALGNYIAGAFGDDDALMADVLAAGRSAGEELWRMPVFELQRDALRSEIADMKNSGERWGGSINAALFLKEFVTKDVPWVHLDIAGPSQSPKDRGYEIKGGSGFGVRTFVELIRHRASLSDAQG